MEYRIPSGLIDKNTEFFTAVVNNIPQPFCSTSGTTYHFDNTPAHLLMIISNDMQSRNEIERDVVKMVGNDHSEKLKKYIMCRYGALNTEPDIDEHGNLSEPEFVPCQFRGTCKFEGRVCCTIKISDTIYLSKAETRVFRLINLPDKVIASLLFLSVDTIKTHIQNIAYKTGFNTKTEMAVYATKKGII